MILAKKCFFCVSLQTGCIIVALFGIFIAGMNIDYIMYLLNRTYVRKDNFTFPAKVFHACLQIIAELLSICASCLLIFAVLSRYSCVFWTTLIFQILQPVYLISYSIISSAMGQNLIVNVSFWHNMTYWVFVVLWLALTLYFIYITFSYYRELEEREIENIT